jgi:hypothetical protein
MKTLDWWRNELTTLNRVARMGCTPEQVEAVAQKIYRDLFEEED